MKKQTIKFNAYIRTIELNLKSNDSERNITRFLILLENDVLEDSELYKKDVKFLHDKLNKLIHERIGKRKVF